MTERTDRIPVFLPDGQQIEPENKYEQALADRIALSSKDNPVSVEEIGAFVFGNHFTTEVYGQPLTRLAATLNTKLAQTNWQISSSVEKDAPTTMWISPVVEEEILAESQDTAKQATFPTALTTVSTEITAAERIEQFTSNILEKLSPIDLENVEDEIRRAPEQIKMDIDEVARYVTEFSKGEFEDVPASQLLEGTVEDKVAVAGHRLKNLIALSITQPTNPVVRTKFGWGKEMNDMILFAGGGDRGREVVFEALFNLSEIERALALSQISMSKRYEIMMVGLDQQNEREMAFFMNNAVYKYFKSGETEALELIVTSIRDREALDGFVTGRVVDEILEHYPDGANFIFDKMTEAAKQADFVEDLIALFCSNKATANRGHQLVEGDDYNDNIVPYKKRDR